MPNLFCALAYIERSISKSLTFAGKFSLSIIQLKVYQAETAQNMCQVLSK